MKLPTGNSGNLIRTLAPLDVDSPASQQGAHGGSVISQLSISMAETVLSALTTQ